MTIRFVFALAIAAAILTGCVPAPTNAQEKDLSTLKQRLEQAKSSVHIGKETVTVQAHDLDNAKDTIVVLRLDKEIKGKAIKVLVAPLPKASIRGDKVTEIEVSVGKPLMEELKISLEALGRQYPDLGKRIQDNPLDLRGNLALAEEKLGLDKTRDGLSLVERSYRLTWKEGLSHIDEKNVTLTFMINKK
ncbi:MAG: hypothetical protein KBC95_05165 [Candidatus Peribacteraceae bacterium]|nr:hypothetical protein [Candidatus Peribacteraceae bacterium]